jgi:hypothetical protein
MSKRGMPGLASGDIKAPSPLSVGHKQLVSQMLPSRHAKAQLAGGDAVQQSLGNYAKQSPAGASGAGALGMNINTMPMMGPQPQ